jgi:non-homologous end joining protein Ku
MAFRKGIVVQLGMVTMIADVDTAVRKEESLKQVCTGGCGHEHAPATINQKRVCQSSGDEVPYTSIKKAKLVGEQFVVVEQDEVAEAKSATLGATKKVIGLTPHPVEGVEGKILPGGSIYALQPSDPAQTQAYAMLHDTITRHPEIVLLGLWTPTSRASLFRFGTFGDALVMEQQYRTEDIAIVEPMIPPIPAPMQAQVDLLLPMMMQPFDPATYADTYAAALADLIASKEAVAGIVGERPKSEGRTPTPAGGVDLMAQLAAAVEQAQAAQAKPARKAKVSA